MDPQAILLGIFILVLLIVLFYKTNRAERLAATIPTFKSYYDMSDKERIDYVYRTYFTGPDEIVPTTAVQDQAAAQAYVNGLPLDSNCVDKFEHCHRWAKNQECVVNPEFMLYSCPHSCQACALTDQQKYDLVQIYNSRPPPKCVYRGEGYPDRLRYLRESEKYDNDPNIPI
jgi:hypothetical protein